MKGDAEQQAFMDRANQMVEDMASWELHEFDIHGIMPDKVACSACWLDGTEPQPEHVIFVLCPRPSSMMAIYRAKPDLRHSEPGDDDGLLYKDTSAIADHTAMVEVVTHLVKAYHERGRHRWEGDGQGPEASTTEDATNGTAEAGDPAQ